MEKKMKTGKFLTHQFLMFFVLFFQVIKAKTCIRFLFQATAKADITLRKLKHLLQPKLDEAGSNKRKRQEKIYEIFLNYLKEVAGTVFCIIYIKKNNIKWEMV